MSAVFNIYDAKSNLSALVQRAAEGEEIVIAKNGKPLAKLVPVEPAGKKPGKRVPAGAMGITFISDDFDAPLPEEVMRAFEGLGD